MRPWGFWVSRAPQFLHCLFPIFALFLQQGSTRLRLICWLVLRYKQEEVPFVSSNKSRKPPASVICFWQEAF